MKKIAALLGLVGVVSIFSSCSTDDSFNPVIPDNNESLVQSSSSVAGKSSASKPTSDGTASSSSKETVVLPEHVYISASSNTTPYYSSGSSFCWSEKCEGISAPTQVSSSSFSLEITISSEAPIYPTVTENQMIDQRDQKKYKLETIGGVHWMAQNLNYETQSGSFCGGPDGKDVCKTYGRFYTISAARKACPTGWRLPTLEEIQAADNTVDEKWWTLGGRVKFSEDETGTPMATDYGLDDQQGYWWTSTGTSWRVQPSSSEHVEQGADAANGRAYSVRCVENK